MAIKKVEIQDHLGNVYYPHTEANVVFTKDGKTVEEKIEDLKLSANNGKNIVANAIGSPLLATDTFDQMGSKIDTLTSQFKTNLTNKGVDVFDTDKMQVLVDKVNDLNTVDIFHDNPSVVSCDYNGGTFLYKFDVNTMTIIKQQSVSGYYPRLAGDYDGRRFKILFSKGTEMHSVDPSTLTTTYLGDLPSTLNEYAVGFAFKDVSKFRVFVVGSRSTSLASYEIDEKTFSIVQTLPYPAHTSGGSFDRDKNKARVFRILIGEYNNIRGTYLQELDSNNFSVISTKKLDMYNPRVCDCIYDYNIGKLRLFIMSDPASGVDKLHEVDIDTTQIINTGSSVGWMATSICAGFGDILRYDGKDYVMQ